MIAYLSLNKNDTQLIYNESVHKLNGIINLLNRSIIKLNYTIVKTI